MRRIGRAALVVILLASAGLMKGGTYGDNTLPAVAQLQALGGTDGDTATDTADALVRRRERVDGLVLAPVRVGVAGVVAQGEGVESDTQAVETPLGQGEPPPVSSSTQVGQGSGAVSEREGRSGEVLLTYYCCTEPNYGGASYCPGDITASGVPLALEDSGRVAACGSDFGIGDTVRLGQRVVTCIDRGYLAPNQVDVWFYSCAEGASWQANQ